MHKIVILDGGTINPGDLSWDAFRAFGELQVYDRTPQELAVERIGDADLIYTSKVAITSAVLDACPGLRYVGAIATGYNVIDVDACKKRGVTVTNIPGYGTAATAQFAMALLLEICGWVGLHDRAVHEGRWSTCPDFCFWERPLIELEGKTMGVVGYGSIGRAVARMAAAFGMKILYNRRNPDRTGDTPDCRYADLEELYACSDVVSLHCPLFPETQGMINAAAIAKMKDGVILLNNSRGPLVVEQDLADALSSGKVYAAGLDVVSVEPMATDNPLLKAPNCIITPHISWAPLETRQRLITMAVENLRQFLQGTPVNVVTP